MERIDCYVASCNPVHNPAPPNMRLQHDRLQRARSWLFYARLVLRAFVGG
jgi:hypothetical protein